MDIKYNMEIWGKTLQYYISMKMFIIYVDKLEFPKDFYHVIDICFPDARL